MVAILTNTYFSKSEAHFTGLEEGSAWLMVLIAGINVVADNLVTQGYIQDIGSSGSIENVGNLKVSDTKLDHIVKGHDPNTYAQQLSYKSQEAALAELESKTFFNSNWSST